MINITTEPNCYIDLVMEFIRRDVISIEQLNNICDTRNMTIEILFNSMNYDKFTKINVMNRLRLYKRTNLIDNKPHLDKLYVLYDFVKQQLTDEQIDVNIWGLYDNDKLVKGCLFSWCATLFPGEIKFGDNKIPAHNNETGFAAISSFFNMKFTDVFYIFGNHNTVKNTKNTMLRRFLPYL